MITSRHPAAWYRGPAAASMLKKQGLEGGHGEGRCVPHGLAGAAPPFQLALALGQGALPTLFRKPAP